jgi:thioredoxin-related protein
LLLSAVIALSAGDIDWRPSYAVAIQQASEANKLVMIDFDNDWWSYCKQMDERTLKDSGVVKEVAQFIPLKLNGEKEGAALASRYHITGYPTILFVDKEGQAIGQVKGFVFPAQFSDEIGQILDAHENLDKYEARIKQNPADALAAERLAAIYAKKGSIRASLSLMPTAFSLDPANRKGALAQALNAIGDYYFESGSKEDYATAASYYQRALDAAKSPSELSYAGEHVAQSYLATDNPELAVPALRQVLQVKALIADERKAVQTMLDTAIQEAGKGK